MLVKKKNYCGGYTSQNLFYWQLFASPSGFSFGSGICVSAYYRYLLSSLFSISFSCFYFRTLAESRLVVTTGTSGAKLTTPLHCQRSVVADGPQITATRSGQLTTNRHSAEPPPKAAARL